MHNVGSAAKDRPYGFALHADAAPMNDAQGDEPSPVGLLEILFDCGFHIARRDRVQVEDIRDGDLKWLFVLHAADRKLPGDARS